MDHDIAYEVEDEAQFWQEVDDIVRPLSTTPDAITSMVNNFISFVSQFGAEYLDADADVETCCDRLLSSDYFRDNAEQVRAAMIEYKPESDKIAKCYVNLYLLLLDGRRHSRTFKLVKRANMVPVIAKLAKEQQADGLRFTRLALTSLYEISRMQKLSEDDMRCFDEEFIWFLLRTVELARDDEDPYSYRCLKVIVSVNEQFMVAALPQAQQPFPKSPSNTSLPGSVDQALTTIQFQNSVVKVLSDHGSRFKAFGENLIRMLNRERDTALQLLILKQLFLLFTSSATYEYFFTNDLRVLVDVFIRELYNLPTEDEALRHTYLRVLHPLLTHTQLRHPPHYKGPELVTLLSSLNQECSHFGPVGATTVRLLARCLTVPWLLPPRRRKIKIPRPQFMEERKKSAKLLGMSLDKSDSASVVSVKSIDSVSAIAKVRPPTTPRVKAPPKEHAGGTERVLSLAPSSAAAAAMATAAATADPLHHAGVSAREPLGLTLAPVKETTMAERQSLERGIIPDAAGPSNDKHENLLREMHKLEVSASV